MRYTRAMNATRRRLPALLAALLPALLAATLLPACAAPTPGGSSVAGDARPARPPKGLPAITPSRPVALDPRLAERARADVAEGFGAADPVLRSQAIEATQRAITDLPPGRAAIDPAVARDRVLEGLRAGEPQVRFAAALAAGALRVRDAYGPLSDLADDPDARVRVASRYGLHRLGDATRSHDLEAMSRDPDRAVRGDVALVLGLLDAPSGRRVLIPMQSDPNPVVRLQVAEALWRLGDERGLESLVAGSINAAEQYRLIALLALAGPRDDRVTGHLVGQLARENGPAVNLVAARALGRVGSDAGYGLAAEGVRSADPRVRGLAALALGDIGRTDAQPLLAPLLDDPDPAVRLAAASAVLDLQG